ncbi:hypothetical protein OE88DRAFT_354144 [Heliocybe sulcata]|uniref:Uncharacterized protein n=1 Tax=Heliocybe sulcata TaxID=5364 RepID=A0A5C3N0H2_9AGAM|nr:hypothetical protein OE88DRAFT_354144 [Heliocybe sulcata]
MQTPHDRDGRRAGRRWTCTACFRKYIVPIVHPRECLRDQTGPRQITCGDFLACFQLVCLYGGCPSNRLVPCSYPL